jgi:hypothetical protein
MADLGLTSILSWALSSFPSLVLTAILTWVLTCVLFCLLSPVLPWAVISSHHLQVAFAHFSHVSLHMLRSSRWVLYSSQEIKIAATEQSKVWVPAVAARERDDNFQVPGRNVKLNQAPATRSGTCHCRKTHVQVSRGPCPPSFSWEGSTTRREGTASSSQSNTQYTLIDDDLLHRKHRNSNV